MNATPRPWVQRGEEINAHRPHVTGGYNEEGVLALTRPPEERRANASLIVRACNTFDEAKAALADAISYFEDAERLLAIRDHVDLSDSLRIGKNRAKAVLAKMEDPHA